MKKKQLGADTKMFIIDDDCYFIPDVNSDPDVGLKEFFAPYGPSLCYRFIKYLCYCDKFREYLWRKY